MTHFAIRLVAAAAFAAAAVPALAAPEPAAPSAKISYADLDLATPGGAAALDLRIKDAARRVCGPVDLGNRAIVSDCRTRVRASAREKLAEIASTDATRLASAR